MSEPNWTTAASALAYEAVQESTLLEVLDVIKIKCYQRALQATGGNVTQAAQILGVHRNTVMNYKRRYRG